jgi:hypothetical protein
VLLDDGGIGAVVAASYRDHVGGLEPGLGRSALKSNSLGAEPRFIFHDDQMAISADD